MNTTTWALLATVGVIAFLLLGEIRRVQRTLNESIRAHYRAISKIPELESKVRALTEKVEALR